MVRNLYALPLALLMAAPALAQTRERTERGARDETPRGRQSDRDDANADAERGARGPRGGEEGDRRGGPFRRSNPMFEAIDVDGDQMISPAELKKAIVAIKKLDADGDGNISLEEVSPRGGPGGDPAEMVNRMFEENDANKDGKLTEDEIPERMAPMLANADTNNDGAISKQELTAAMEQMRGRGPGGGNFGEGRFGGGPAGGVNPEAMIQQMAQYDLDGDGKITAREVPDQMRRIFQAQGADLNNDGGVDASEIKAMAERMSGRFSGRNFNRGPEGGAPEADRDAGRNTGDRRGRAGNDDDAEEDNEETPRTRTPRRGNN